VILLDVRIFAAGQRPELFAHVQLARARSSAARFSAYDKTAKASLISLNFFGGYRRGWRRGDACGRARGRCPDFIRGSVLRNAQDLV